LQGRVVLSGSSTLAPLATAAMTGWSKLHPQVDARVEAIGSDAGMERLIRYGDADFALVSRSVNTEDYEAARSVGKELVVLPLAWDAVCLVVPMSNTWVSSLTPEQIVQAFTTAKLWSDLDSSWPPIPIYRFALGPNSGTADVFAASLFHSDKTPLFSAPGVQSSEDAQILARGVAEVPGALGYLGWTSFRQRDPTLKILTFDGVAPSAESIRNRTYPMPRHLWLVTTKQDLANPAERSMARYLFEHSRSLAVDSGLVPLTDEERAAAGATLDLVVGR
jgi:phosphate transport system substrate-binding protein